MSYPRIFQKVYREAWAIKPTAHHAIRTSLHEALEGRSRSILEDRDELEEEEDNYNLGSTAVIPIYGIIGKHLSCLETACGGCDTDSVALALDQAVADESIDTIVLHIVSAGGTVTGVPELADRIRRASEAKEVIAYTDDLACSAAYWLGSQANWNICLRCLDASIEVDILLQLAYGNKLYHRKRNNG